MRNWIRLAAAVAVLGLGLFPSGAGAKSTLRQMSDDLAGVVGRVMPSVVVVHTETTRVPVYLDFFFRPIPGQPERLAGQGSGVIISEDGYILTSRHVIQNADVIKVVLNDGTEFDAEIVGEDRPTDIGVIKITDPGKTKLVPIEQGDSDALRVGEIVVAIGSPFSLSGSVTMGIVSQKGRTVGVLPYEDFIQTDASINPGNSGGPLVNLDGRMIGLNAVIQTAGPRGSIGIGFAVPCDRAFAIARTLIEGRPVERPWLGIVPREMSRSSAIRLLRLMGREGGVYVAEVFRDTPAYHGGVFRGDLILAVDEEPVTSITELQREVFQHTIGEPVQLQVLRGNRILEVEVETAMMPDARMFK